MPDLTIWEHAPRERTASYYPVYAVVSKAMQRTTRSWIREGVAQHPELLSGPMVTAALLAYHCSTPFVKPVNAFGYDVQDQTHLDKLFGSIAWSMTAELETLPIADLPWRTRQQYFPYRSSKLVARLRRQPLRLFKMLRADVALMDVLLRFALIDLPERGIEYATDAVRKAFATHLRRLTTDVDLTGKAEDLLRVATEALSSELTQAQVA